MQPRELPYILFYVRDPPAPEDKLSSRGNDEDNQGNHQDPSGFEKDLLGLGGMVGPRDHQHVEEPECQDEAQVGRMKSREELTPHWPAAFLSFLFIVCFALAFL